MNFIDGARRFDIAIYHGTNSSRKETLIQSGKYDVICLWSYTQSANKEIGKTLVINPGTANGWFFRYGATAAVFDTRTKEPEFLSL